MFKIDTMKGHDRMSTQDLLLAIEEAVRQGETDFEVAASGQHDGCGQYNSDNCYFLVHVSSPYSNPIPRILYQNTPAALSMAYKMMPRMLRPVKPAPKDMSRMQDPSKSLF